MESRCKVWGRFGFAAELSRFLVSAIREVRSKASITKQVLATLGVEPVRIGLSFGASRFLADGYGFGTVGIRSSKGKDQFLPRGSISLGLRLRAKGAKPETADPYTLNPEAQEPLSANPGGDPVFGV